MKLLPNLLITSLLTFLSFETAAQQATTSPSTSANQSPQRDPQASSILSQTLNAAGGVSTLGSIRDYTASGVITYHWAGKDVEGSVTVRGRRLDQLRMDSNLPTGSLSWAASRGKTAHLEKDGTVSGTQSFAALSPSSFVFPYMELAAAIKSPQFRLSYKGVAEIDGRSAHRIRVQGPLLGPSDAQEPQSDLDAADFFIDTSTLRVVMLQEITRPAGNGWQGPVHQIRFSDYRTLNGVLVPFSMVEAIGAQQTWTIQLESISFNSGLSESNFEL